MNALLALLLLTGQALAQEPSSEPTDGGEIPIEELPIIEMPSILEYIEAPYPEQAQEQGLQGTVVLIVEIDDTGVVVNAEVPAPIGNGFDEAAKEAVLAMRFTPALTEAGPVPVIFEFAYGFVLTPADEIEDDTPVAPPPVNFDGDVIEMGTRTPVEGARVVVDGTELSVKTDATGHFELRGVPIGTQTVRVLHTGHVVVDAEVDIPEGEAVTWRFWMRAESYRANEAVAVYRKEKEEVTRRTITIEEVRKVPGTFGDPLKVVQTLPGAARTPFGTGILIIRGSDPEDSGVYVDGVRVPIMYHLTGTTSVLSPEIIESVDYLPGGYGVQYGRSMGGVVDVRTKDEFEDGKLIWGTDILDSQIYYEGHVGKNDQHGIALAARRSYVDAFLPYFVKSAFVIKPRYWDYQAKWVPELPGEQRLSAFLYGYDDVITVSSPEDIAQGPDADTQGAFRTHYGSHRLLLNYDLPVSEQLHLTITPSYGIDLGEFGLGQEFKLTEKNTLVEVRVELPWTPSEAFQLVPGVDLIGGWGGFDFASALSSEDIDDPLAERDPMAFGGTVSGWGPDLYLKANLRPMNDRDRLLITPGIRADLVHFVYGGDLGEDVRPWTAWAFDPRIATRIELTDGAVVKASSGIYQQTPMPFEAIGIGADVELSMEYAWANSIGFEHQLTPALHWDLELFHKSMENLVVIDYDGFEGMGSNAFVNNGQGVAYGLEFIARHDPIGRFFGWISYTLSRSTRQDWPGDRWYSFEFDQTHILSAQGGYDLPMDFTVSAQVQYVSGIPTTTYNAGIYDVDSDWYQCFRIGGYNDERLPPYFQTSVRLDRLWTFKKWQLDTYVDLLHIVRGVNPEITMYCYDCSDWAYVRGLPFIPNVGIEAKFWP